MHHVNAFAFRAISEYNSELSSLSSRRPVFYTFHNRSCTKLERIDLEDCINITDSSVICFSMNCPNLANLVSWAVSQMCDNGKKRERGRTVARRPLKRLLHDKTPEIFRIGTCNLVFGFCVEIKDQLPIPGSLSLRAAHGRLNHCTDCEPERDTGGEKCHAF